MPHTQNDEHIIRKFEAYFKNTPQAYSFIVL